MRALSAWTSVSDPYRAGVTLGEQLKAISPEVVLLFTSIHYGETPETLAGLYDGLEDEGVVVVGNTGDGIYGVGRVAHLGASALALNSEGRVRWLMTHAPRAGVDAAACLRQCLAQLVEQAPAARPAFLFLAADFHADSTKIEEVLQSSVEAPVIGGLAADDNLQVRSYVYSGREVLQDSMVLLGAYGEVAIDIVVGNTMRPVGRPGVVVEAEGVHLGRIDGLSAMGFIERETGKPALQTDRGIVSLRLLDPQHPGQWRLRSIIPEFKPNGGTIGLYGSISKGKMVQVCVAEPDELLDEVSRIAKAAPGRLEFQPAAALIVSCAGRKWLLGGRVGQEVEALATAFPKGLPLAGFPSFGEIGPLKEDGHYTRSYAHNMSYVLMLIGDREWRTAS